MGVMYNFWKGVDKSLGRHNDALYAVLAIATFKGVMRPTFTMMDKHSDKETKKYAAFREGLTEAIAFASYILTHKLVVPRAEWICKKVNKMEKLNKVKNGLSILSVCLTAGVIIPAVCNLTLKPIMNVVTKFMDNRKTAKSQTVEETKSEEEPSLDIKENAVSEKTPVLNAVNITPVNSKSLLTVLQNQTALRCPEMRSGAMNVR